MSKESQYFGIHRDFWEVIQNRLAPYLGDEEATEKVIRWKELHDKMENADWFKLKVLSVSSEILETMEGGDPWLKKNGQAQLSKQPLSQV